MFTWRSNLLWLILTLPVYPQSLHYARLEREDIFKRLEKVTRGDAARRAEIKSLFIRAGCKDEHLTDQPVTGSDAANLVCALPGKTGEVIVVGANFAAPPDSDGVARNWSGAVLLPSLYQSLYQTVRKYTYVFVAFAGDAGAREYAGKLSKEEAKEVRAFVHIDTLGMSFTRVWIHNDHRILYGYMKAVSSAVMLPVEFVEYKGAAKGVRPFLKRGIPSITIHALTKYNHKVAGSPEDTLDVIKRNEYYESYMIAAAYLAYLDVKLP